MVINALNSGAEVFMADFEDATSPTWENLIEGQLNLRDAIRRTISFTSPEGKAYALKPRDRDARGAPARLASAREARAPRRQAPSAARSSTSGSTFSTMPKSALARGTGPYFYLPKMESHLEARLWNDVFVHAQATLGVPAWHDPRHGAHRDDPRDLRSRRDPLRTSRSLRGPQLRPLGLHLQLHQEARRPAPVTCFPDRTQVTMTAPFMRAYSLLRDQGLPPPRCARDGRHGRADSDQERPRRERRRARQGPRRQGARSLRRP